MATGQPCARRTLRGNVSAGGKPTTRWDELKSFGK